jgi:hypothetical protein
MKKKYFELYIIESIITFLIALVFIVSGILGKSIVGIDYFEIANRSYIMYLQFIIAIALFIVTIRLKIKKYSLDVQNVLFPISYFIFMIFIIIVAFILNYYVVVKNMHLLYYYNFILFDYILLSLYTVFSFKK